MSIGRRKLLGRLLGRTAPDGLTKLRSFMAKEYSRALSPVLRPWAAGPLSWTWFDDATGLSELRQWVYELEHKLSADQNDVESGVSNVRQ